VKRGEKEATGFPPSSAGGGGGLLRLRRPSWRREVEKTVDLSLAGSLGPRYLGLVSWRRRRTGWPALQRNKSLHPVSRRGGASSGAFVRAVRGSSSRFVSYDLWWASTGVFLRLVVLWVFRCYGGGGLERCLLFFVSGGVCRRATAWFVVCWEVDSFFLPIVFRGRGAIQVQASVGCVPGRWAFKVQFFSSPGARFYCGFSKSFRAMALGLIQWRHHQSSASLGACGKDGRWRRLVFVVFMEDLLLFLYPLLSCVYSSLYVILTV